MLALTSVSTSRRYSRLSLFAVSLAVALSSAVSAFAETATVQIKGMICESCSQAVTTKLKSAPEVESVAVNVKKGFAEIVIKQGSSISDESIKNLISDAGYTATEIARKP